MVSADCTKMPPVTQLTAGDGAIWTVLPVIGGVAGQIGVARSGVRVTQSADFVTIKGGAICQRDEGIWECWAGSWTPSATITCP